MPIYVAGGPKSTVMPGYANVVWNNELISVASPPSPPEEMSSVQVAIHRDGHFPQALGVEVIFSANPGAFQLDLQTADTDESKYYVTKASMTTGLNADYVGRMEVTNVVAKFARLRMVLLTNAVRVTAKIS